MYVIKLKTRNGSEFTLSASEHPSWCSATNHAQSFPRLVDAKWFARAMLEHTRLMAASARETYGEACKLAQTRGASLWVVGPRGSWARVTKRTRSPYFVV